MNDNRQFLRYAEVEIRDFNSNIKTTLGNEFEIEFEYFKTIDHSKDDDRGTIKIYGLSDDTIKSLQFEGGEVRLYCGYSYTDISLLFIASIVRVYSEVVSNTTVTTIDCNANLLDYYTLISVDPETKDLVPLMNYLVILAKQMGADDLSIDFGNFSKQAQADILHYFYNVPVKAILFASVKDILNILATNFGIVLKKIRDKDGRPKISVTLTGEGLAMILKARKSGYAEVKVSPQILENRREVFKTYAADTSSKEVTYLGRKTGLLSFQKEYKVSKTYFEQKRDVKNSEVGDWINTETTTSGIVYKYKKSFWKAKALLNPKILPQSLVAISDNKYKVDELRGNEINEELIQDVLSSVGGDKNKGDVESFSLTRVRDVSYKGNNKRGEWVMELYCEDGTRDTVTEEEAAEYARTNAEDAFEFFEDEETKELKAKEAEEEKQRKAQEKKDKEDGG